VLAVLPGGRLGFTRYGQERSGESTPTSVNRDNLELPSPVASLDHRLGVLVKRDTFQKPGDTKIGDSSVNDGAGVDQDTSVSLKSGGSVGIGFAISSNLAERVADQLIEFGQTRRGWLGVYIQEVTSETWLNQLADALEGWDAYYAYNQYAALAYLYKTEVIKSKIIMALIITNKVVAALC